MPRYFFNSENGECLLDEEGTELPDEHAARLAAVGALGELLRERPEDFWKTEHMRVIVTDDTGLTLFMIDATSLAAPASSRPLKPRG